MADLPQFNAPTEQAHGANSEALQGGIEANVQAGRRIGTFYDQSGRDIGAQITSLGEQVQAHITFTQQSHGIATAATLSNAQHQAADQVFKDNSIDKRDPTIAPKLIQQNNEAWDEWAKGYSTEKGQQWAIDYALKEKTDYQDYVVAQQSKWSSIQSVQDHQTTVDQSAQQAALTPNNTDALMEKANGVLDAGISSGVVRSDDAEKLEPARHEGEFTVAMSGAKGSIYGPDVTDPVASVQQFFLSNPKAAAILGDQRAELEHAAEEQAKSLLTQKEAANRLQRQQMEDEGKTVIAKDLVEMHSYTDAGKVIPPDRAAQFAKDQVKYAPFTDTAVLGTTTDDNIKGNIDRTYQRDTDTALADDAHNNAWQPDWNPVPLQTAYNNGTISAKTLKDALDQHDYTQNNPAAAEDQRTTLDWYTQTAAPMLVAGMNAGALTIDPKSNTYTLPTAGQKDQTGAATLAYGKPLILNLYRALVTKYGGDTAKAREVLMDRNSPEGAYPIFKWLVAVKAAGGPYSANSPAVPGEIGGNVPVGGTRVRAKIAPPRAGESAAAYYARTKGQ